MAMPQATTKTKATPKAPAKATTQTTKQKLTALRVAMRARGLAAFHVPSTDPHQSEYVPACWQRRVWMSGFTGSAGELLVTASNAYLWTDGRYFLQATEELRGSGIQLMKMAEPGVPTLAELLQQVLRRGEALGVDPKIVTPAGARALEQATAEAGARVVFTDENLVDLVWTDRPALSAGPVVAHSKKYSGEDTRSKLRRLRAEMKQRGAEAHPINALDAIAWLYNIRGRDVEYNPVVISYALVTMKEATLFVDSAKVSPEVRRALGPDVTVRPYEEFEGAVRQLASRKVKIWIDPTSASRWMLDLAQGAPTVKAMSPVFPMKARKNATEIAGMKASHVRDGVAMVRFLHWLEREAPKRKLTEISAADKLAAIRSEGELFQGLSFRTISGYGAHGAIIHYSVTPETDIPLEPKGIYLVDSGAQYLDGTIDITRTVAMGKGITKEQRDRFTRVLKGHIALARAKFPAGTRALRLDTLARIPLWEAGLDYNHGTGHGVGAYLNVHEGPQSISPWRDQQHPIEEGNIFSNEPGYYEPGVYGIRIESLIVVRRDAALSNGIPWYGFETITMCPIDTRLIEKSLMSKEEVSWLDDYHRTVFRTLSPHLEKADRNWLKSACSAL